LEKGHLQAMKAEPKQDSHCKNSRSASNFQFKWHSPQKWRVPLKLRIWGTWHSNKTIT